MTKPSHHPHSCQACGVTFSRHYTVKQHWQKKQNAGDLQHHVDFQNHFALLVPPEARHETQVHTNNEKRNGNKNAKKQKNKNKAKTIPHEEEEEEDAPHEIDDTNYGLGGAPEPSNPPGLNPAPDVSFPFRSAVASTHLPASTTGRGRRLSCYEIPPEGTPVIDHELNRRNRLLTDLQLRSSRITRNQDPNASLARNRAGVIDYDPTDGLPVRKWEFATVKVKQDVPNEVQNATNETVPNPDDDYPWPELPLPSFFHQLPGMSQMLLRRARMGDRNAKPSVWDNKNECWIPAAEAEARANKLKSRHLMDPDTTDTPASANDDDDGGKEVIGEDVEDMPPGGLKKRKVTTGGMRDSDPDERYYEVKKWVQIPVEKAEKMEEKKYLADRRPGMPSLYGGAYQSTSGFGAIGAPGTEAVNPLASGFDLGDGSGLGNAAGMLSGSGEHGLAGAQGLTPTPVRKNMPPRRKKKKLGGPGRKKAIPIQPVGDNTTGDVNMTDAGNDTQEKPATETSKDGENVTDTNVEGEDVSGSESDEEGEGSEEGEIEEEHHEAQIVHTPGEPLGDETDLKKEEENQSNAVEEVAEPSKADEGTDLLGDLEAAVDNMN